MRRQACDSALQHAVTLTGNYERHECGIIITGAQLQDAGQWTCEVSISIIIIIIIIIIVTITIIIIRL